MNQSINTDSKNSKEPQQKYRLGMVSIKILGGLNQFYGHPTSPSSLLKYLHMSAENLKPFHVRTFPKHKRFCCTDIVTSDKAYYNTRVLNVTL